MHSLNRLLIIALLCLCLPSYGQGQGAPPNVSGWKQSRWNIRFKAGAEPPGWVHLAKVDDIRTIGVSVIRGSAQAVESLRTSAEWIEEDVPVPPDYLPNDPQVGQQWQHAKVQAPTAWDKTSGAGVIVAILDTGCDPTHPDLASRYVGGWNVYDGNSNWTDVYGHGTAVAGMAAAIGNNGTGVAGLAWSSSLMPVRISGTDGWATYSRAAAGVTWAADHGARVANVSYQMWTSSTFIQACLYAKSKGCVVTVSAGNTGTFYSYPDDDSNLTIASSNQADARSSWSTYGPMVDFSAPGDGVLTTSRGGGYGYWSGTSFAAPYVAGAAALVIANRPDYTAHQVMLALKTTVDPGGYNGRLNAARALGAVIVGPTDPPPPDPEPDPDKGNKGGNGKGKNRK